MRNEILKLIEHLNKEKEQAITQQGKAECELDEGFFNGIKTAYKHVVGTLENILIENRGK